MRRAAPSKLAVKPGPDGARGANVSVDPHAATEPRPNDTSGLKPPPNAGADTTGMGRPHGTSTKHTGAGTDSLAKPGSAAPRGKDGAAGVRGSTGNTRKVGPGKAAAAGSREPLAPQPGASNATKAQLNAANAMPPPPAKVSASGPFILRGCCVGQRGKFRLSRLRYR